MCRENVFALLLLTCATATAQTHIGLSASLGTQFYQSSTDKTRLVPGADALVEYRRVGLQVAGEWTNRSTGGSFSASHLDLTYRAPFEGVFSILVGAGATGIHLEAGGDHATTWNAQVEFSRRYARAEIYGRLRHYDYSFQEFRTESISPGGPAMSFGVRLRLR